MSGEPIVVVIGHPDGDPSLQIAMQHLLALSERLLLRPFWFVDSSGEPDEQIEAVLVRVALAVTD